MGSNIRLVHKRNPGTSIGLLVLFSNEALKIPVEYAEKEGGKSNYTRERE